MILNPIPKNIKYLKWENLLMLVSAIQMRNSQISSGMSGAIFLPYIGNIGSLICHFRDVNTLVWRAKDVHDVTYSEGNCCTYKPNITERNIFAQHQRCMYKYYTGTTY